MPRSKKTPKKSKPAGQYFYVVGGKQFVVRKNLLDKIARLQRSTKLCCPRAAFGRLIREIMQGYGRDLRLQSLALQALQEISEIYLTHLFADTCACALHARRVTITPKDMKLVLKLRESF